MNETNQPPETETANEPGRSVVNIPKLAKAGVKKWATVCAKQHDASLSIEMANALHMVLQAFTSLDAVARAEALEAEARALRSK